MRHWCTPPRTNGLRPWRGYLITAPIPNAGPYQGCGALHLAAAFGAAEFVRLLVAASADIDRTNEFNGDNALGWSEYVLDQERPGNPQVTAVRDFLRNLGSHPIVWGA